jgi:PAS domain S-box-containing protein
MKHQTSYTPEVTSIFVPEVERYLECRSNPVLDEHGNVVRIIEQLRDITDHWQTERLKTIRLELIEFAAGHSLSETQTKALDLTESFLDSTISFFHFVEPDQKTLSLQQWSTATREKFCRADRRSGRHYTIDQAGVWVDCVREGKAVIHNDYAALSHKKGLPPGHALVIRELVVPVIRGKRLVAILGVGNKATDYTHHDSDRLTYLADIIWEIIKRKRSEEVLIENERHLSSILENMTDLVWSVNLPKNTFQYISPAVEAIYGYPAQAFYENPNLWRELTHPEDRHLIEVSTENLYKNGSTVRESRIIRPNGDIAWTLYRSKLIRDQNGTPRRIEGITQDITDRKRAEDVIKTKNEELAVANEELAVSNEELMHSQTELMEREAKLLAVLDSIPFPVAVADLNDEKISYWSRKAVELFGHTASTVVEWYENAYPDPCYRQSVIERWKPFLEIARNSKSAVNTGEYRVTCSDGSEKICEIHAALISDSLIVTFNDITERKRAEEVIIRSEKRYRHLVDFLPIALFEIDKDGTLIFANNAFTKMSEYTEADIGKGLNIFQLLAPEDRDRAIANSKHVLMGEKFGGVEYSVVKKNGKEIPILVFSSYASFDSIPVQLGIAIDQTDRKQAEEDLRESEEKYRSLFDQSTEGIYLHDLEGRILDVNEMACAQSGYSREELLGRTIFDNHPIQSSTNWPKDKILQAWNDWRPEQRSTIDGEHQRKDGTVYPVAISTGKVRYGNTDVILALVKDITERKRAEKELRESEERYRLLVDFSSDMIWQLNLDGTFAYISPSWKTILGYNSVYLTGTAFQPLIHPDDLAVCERYMVNTIEAGQSLPGPQYRVKHVDGDWRWHEARVTPVYNNDGSFMHFVGVSRDITERKRVEETIKRQLEEKEILLKETHHRILNNITTIKNLLTLQSNTVKNPEAASILNEAIGRVHSIAELYQKMLITSDYQSASTAQYLGDLADSAIALFADQKKVTLKKQLGDDLIDAKKLFLLGIITNELLTNVMKYAFVGRAAGTIEVSFTKTGSKAALTIQDDGVGLTDGLDIESPKQFGLMLVRMLAQQLEGTFSIESHQGTRSVLEFEV